jgi:hypothetical protein
VICPASPDDLLPKRARQGSARLTAMAKILFEVFRGGVVEKVRRAIFLTSPWRWKSFRPRIEPAKQMRSAMDL